VKLPRYKVFTLSILFFLQLRRPDLKKVADSVDLKSQDGYASSSSSSSSSSSDSSVDSDSDSVWSDEEAPATKKKRYRDQDNAKKQRSRNSVRSLSEALPNACKIS